ncbi:MAG: rubredoxin, partial [Tissierellia bacterium]|nr:rubredoxin [Tissierellia bacterium]
MNKYICSICGYEYDEQNGIPESGIEPGTKWEDLPEDWVCPLCGADKTEFKKQGQSSSAKKTTVTKIETSEDIKELSPLEISALCTNLARGCEKQYKVEEASLFTELAGYFKAAAAPVDDPNIEKLINLIEKDLEEGFPNVNSVASDYND